MKKLLILFACTLSFNFSFSQCGPLTTLYAGNNGQDGIMFDITALQNVVITNFDIDAYGNTHTYEIYYKAGTHVGFQANAAAWTLLGTAANVPGNPRNSPTAIPITISVPMCPGDTYAFYLTSTSTSGSISYTNGTAVGNVYAADANIQVKEGTGKDYPFAASFQPRIPNITVYYSCLSGCCVPPTMSSAATSCSTSCNGTATATVTGGFPPFTYQWNAAAGNQTTQTATGLCPGTYSVNVTDNNGCTASGTVTVAAGPAPPNATITPAGPFCTGSPAVNLTAATGGGTWSGTGITNPATGTFNPATAGVGSHVITYTIGGACGATDTETIIVNANANATITPAGPFCLGDPAVNLTAATGGGTWSGTGITNGATGTFNPATAGVGSHTITYTIPGSCGATDTETIVVNANANATITPAGPFCTGDPAVNLTAATGGGTWSGTGITNGASGTFDPAVAGPGTHTITYTIPGSCGATDTENIVVNSNAVATITPTTLFCEGDPAVNLTAASPGGTWSGNGITNGATGAFDPAVAGPGTHTITYTIPGSCGATDTENVTVAPPNGPPPSASQFNTASNGAGGTLPGGSNDLNWEISTALAGPYAPAIVMTSIPGSYYNSPWPDADWIAVNSTGSHGGNVDYYYRITVDLPCLNECGVSYSVANTFCLTMDFFVDNSVNEIYVNGVAQSPTQPLIPVANQYGNVGFSAAGGLTITLCNDWQPGPNVLIIKTSSGGPFQGFLAQYSTNPPPPMDDPTISAPNNDSVFCSNEPTVTFTAASPGGNWSSDCGPCLNASGTFDPATAGVGTYNVYYTTASVCPQTDTLIVTVTANLDATITQAGPFCESAATVTISAATGGGTWSGTGITNPATGSFDPAAATPGTWLITYTITGNCGNTDTANITVLPDADATITPAGPFCDSDPAVNLTSAQAGGVWGGTGITNTASGTFDPAVSGSGTFLVTYSIGGQCGDTDTEEIIVSPQLDATITPAGPFCESDAATTLAAADPGGTWGGTGITNTTTGSFDPAVALPGSHTITYMITSACGDTATTVIDVNPDMDAAITPAGPFCIGNTAVNLTAADPGGTWSGTGITNAVTGSFDPATAGIGTHTVTYAIAGMCGDTQFIDILVTPNDDATITPAGPFCTDANPVILTAADPGGTWSGNGITNTVTGSFDPFAAGAGTHTITYSIPGACGDTQTTGIVVNPLPNVSFTSDITSGCEILPVMFYNTTTGSNNCSWNFGNGITSNSCDSVQVNFAPGVYTVTLTTTDANGCSNTTVIPNMITSFSYPIASFSWNPQPATSFDPNIDFDNNSMGGSTYQWDFAGLGNSAQFNPSFMFPGAGTYPVTLYTTSANGCVDSTVQLIVINEEFIIYVPNAFTPDGIGPNEVFMPVISGLETDSYHLYIFNRWGELLFHSEDYTKGWDGSYKGMPAKQDVYVWRLLAKPDGSAEVKEFFGNVTLLR